MANGLAVIVPALNEADNLGDLLEDLARQSPAPDEVIVVDAGSSDGTGDLVERQAFAWPALRVVRLDGAAPGRARNEGIRRSACELIATVDAGSRVGGDWLASLSAPLRAGAADAFCVGVAAVDAHSPFERAAGWFTLRAFKPVGARPPLAPSYRPAGRNGLCFQRRSWEAAGGYPEEFPWGEDKVFLERLSNAGLELISVPEATVRWRPRRSLRELFRQYEGYGRGDALARIDRQNELITIALYGLAAALAVAALGGLTAAAIALGVGAVAYLLLFTVAALGELGFGPALGWIPIIRIITDLAKIRGFIAASVGRLVRVR